MTRSHVVCILGSVLTIVGVAVWTGCTQKESTRGATAEPAASATSPAAEKQAAGTQSPVTAQKPTAEAQKVRPGTANTPAATAKPSGNVEQAKPAPAPAAMKSGLNAPKPADAPQTVEAAEPVWRKFLADAINYYHFSDTQRSAAEAILTGCLDRANTAKQEYDRTKFGANAKGDAAASAAADAKFSKLLQKLDEEVYGRIDGLASMAQLQNGLKEGFQSPRALRAPKRPEVGQEAPDFELKDAQGQTVSLASLRGKTVVLHFWATWCGYCKKAMPDIQKLQEAVKDRSDVVVLGVNCAQRPNNPDPAEYFKQQGCTYRVLLNGDAAATAYEVRGYPMLYVIGPDGKIIFKESGAVASQSERILALLKSPLKKA